MATEDIQHWGAPERMINRERPPPAKRVVLADDRGRGIELSADQVWRPGGEAFLHDPLSTGLWFTGLEVGA